MRPDADDAAYVEQAAVDEQARLPGDAFLLSMLPPVGCLVTAEVVGLSSRVVVESYRSPPLAFSDGHRKPVHRLVIGPEDDYSSPVRHDRLKNPALCVAQ